MTLAHIPTNIITGFLGVGKTTAILHLLKNKPADEHWAVLVNEFGEVGIDGALVRQSGAFVREVPGGCMCCVMGVPMQIGIQQLLAQSRPHRLLIEPTGLGHPAQIIETLRRDHLKQLLDLRATMTLVDPRKLTEARYVENGNFRDQIAVADVLVANKMDVCSADDIARFHHFSESLSTKPQVRAVTQGKVDPAWLDLPRSDLTPTYVHHHTAAPTDSFALLPTPDEALGSVMRENKGQGFVSCGWVFHPRIVFSFDALFAWLSGLTCDRVKAVMITDQGIAAFNAENGVLSVLELDDSGDSRLEIINAQPLAWQTLGEELDQLRLT